jgi:hypothetical protein
MPLQLENLVPGCRVPESHAIAVGRSELLAVRGKGDALDVDLEAFDRSDGFAVLGVPENHAVVMTGRGEVFAIGAEHHVVNSAVMSFERQEEFCRLRVPNLHRGIPVASG